jgi:hypothetical protein
MTEGSAVSPSEHLAEHNNGLSGSAVGQQVTLRIADQTLRFRAGGHGVELFLHDNHAAFRVPDKTPANCEVDWTIGPVVPAEAPVMRRFEQRWEVRRLSNGHEEITFYNAIGNDPTLQPTMQMVSDPEFTSIKVRQASRGDGESYAYVSEYPWAEYIVQRRMGLHGGVILHASMAVVEGVAHVFTGHSGAGKSTIAELAESLGASIPTDDRTILTTGAKGVTAWGTPWHGSFRRTSPDGAPVGNISLLVHDSVDCLEPIEPARAVMEMFVRTVQARITEREVQTTLTTLETIAARVPFFELRFLPTPEAVRLVLRAPKAP